MQTFIWKGIEYNSLEYFNIQKSDDEFSVISRIIGTYKTKIYFVEYAIQIDGNWNVQKLNINYETDKIKKQITTEKAQKHWTINEELKPEYENFTYIDISLTPFTNSLPINNLHLKIDEEKIIDVIYFDLLENAIKPVRQKYKRLGNNIYKYENIPNNFESIIEVDSNGFVQSYPKLFERIL